MKTISKILVIALVAVSVNVNANVKGDDKNTSNNSTSVAALTISGQVVDKETGEPLIGANVTVKNVPGLGAITNIDGKYHIGTKIDPFYCHKMTKEEIINYFNKN